MDRSEFLDLAMEALDHLDEALGNLEHDGLDVQLAGEVLTLTFADGGKFIINAHSAAQQVWMAADRSAWHFSWDSAQGRWIAGKTGDELMRTVGTLVGARLGGRSPGL